MNHPKHLKLENKFEDILFHTIQDKLYEKRMENVGFQAAILAIYQEVLEFSDNIVQELEANGQSPEVACISGCSYCCHSQVNVIPIEALIIAALIETDFSYNQKGSLRDGISRTRSMTNGKTPEETYALKDDLPCLFLTKGKCSIYKNRPSICRSWNSLDVDSCKSAYCSIDFKSSISVSPVRNFVFGTTRALFGQLSKELSLQSETLLLYDAVSDCLGISDPLGQWVRGCDVFNYG